MGCFWSRPKDAYTPSVAVIEPEKSDLGTCSLCLSLSLCCVCLSPLCSFLLLLFLFHSLLCLFTASAYSRHPADEIPLRLRMGLRFLSSSLFWLQFKCIASKLYVSTMVYVLVPPFILLASFSSLIGSTLKCVHESLLPSLLPVVIQLRGKSEFGLLSCYPSPFFLALRSSSWLAQCTCGWPSLCYLYIFSCVT